MDVVKSDLYARALEAHQLQLEAIADHLETLAAVASDTFAHLAAMGVLQER